MKSIFRYSVLLMAVVLIALPLGAIHAQGDLCATFAKSGLSADDCALLQGAMAQENMAKLNAFTADYSLAFKLAGAGPTSDSDITVKGSGPISFDMAAAMKNDNAAMQQSLKLQQTITISGTSAGKAADDTVDVVIVDGKVYWKDNQAPSNGKWLFQSLSSASSMASSNPMTGMMTGGAANPAAAAMMADPKVAAAFQAMLQTPGFVTITSTANGDEKDIMATVDVNALLASKDLPAQVKTLITAISAASGSAASADTAQLDQQIPTYIQLASMYAKSLKLNMTWTVGSSDKLLHGFALHLDYTLDPSMAAGLTGGAASGSTSTTPVNLTVDVKAHLSNIGQAVDVTAPDGATEFKGSASAVATAAQ